MIKILKTVAEKSELSFEKVIFIGVIGATIALVSWAITSVAAEMGFYQ